MNRRKLLTGLIGAVVMSSAELGFTRHIPKALPKIQSIGITDLLRITCDLGLYGQSEFRGFTITRLDQVGVREHYGESSITAEKIGAMKKKMLKNLK